MERTFSAVSPLSEVKEELMYLGEVPIVEVLREREEVTRTDEESRGLSGWLRLLIGYRYVRCWFVKSFREEYVRDSGRSISICLSVEGETG